ncbi:TatD family hydrolase [Candidatus Bathycorpusculum sp.]|jgi:TatD DNase family protein|uniref:TatD family hydrolase n=1 Tax=Candidatus Bathycorpusculum sp. TaxID=2994959 RepID=UPI00281EC7F3|nr:TatD family hydrolase [Candidatus Termitimicrobium sp.]MCL2431248.1 TatD family hydrolase [Candidatus Termitimicrobium sp.]
MKLIDAHVHLSETEYTGRIDELIADAKNSGVTAIVTNSIDLVTCQKDIHLSQLYPGLVYPALGIHPWNVNMLKENELQETIDYIQSQKGKVVAIGEIGLDYKYESTWEQQTLVFDKMLCLAETMDLPVIIHSRGTTDKIVEMLPSYRFNKVLLHWFSHPIAALTKAIDRGYFITEGPPVSYSNGIREVVEKTPLTNLLTETDGPVTYWKQPYNGQLTKPSHIRSVVDAVADIKKMPAEEVAEQIAQNFEVFFNIKP